MNRSLRRHEAQKAKNRARRMLRLWQQGEWPKRPRDPDPVEIAMFAKTPKPCSCVMCANRRRFDGPSVQERRDPSSSPE